METAMLDNPYLDTIISMVLVYATLSVLVSMINEWYVKHVGQRGTFLKAMIERMLNDPNNYEFGHMIYVQPAIARLRKDADHLPAYISASTFATALMDLIGEQGYTRRKVDLGNGSFRNEKADPAEPLAKRFRNGLVALNDSQIKTLLLGMADRSMGAGDSVDLEQVRKSIGEWFDDHMERVSGQYKDKQRYRLFGIACFVALFLNVDSVHLLRVIFMDEPLRMGLVQQAEATADQITAQPDSVRNQLGAQRKALMAARAQAWSTNPDTAAKGRTKRDSVLAANMDRVLYVLVGDTMKQEVQEITGLLTDWGLPLGYSFDQPPLVWCNDSLQAQVNATLSTEPLMRYYQKRNQSSFHNWAYWLVGLVLSSLALSAGSSFWFNALVKLVNIRRAGAKPVRMDKKEEE